MGVYKLGKTASRFFFTSTFRVKVIGIENIPSSGGVMICCNHISNLDPPLLGAYVDRPIHYMAKSELFEKPILKTILPKVGAFPVRRGMSDKRALRTAMNHIKNGQMIGIFPEGRRSTDGELGKGLAGAGFLALRTEATIIPAAIIGSYTPFQPLTLVYGKALDFSHMRAQRASAEEATAHIMEHIATLIHAYK